MSDPTEPVDPNDTRPASAAGAGSSAPRHDRSEGRVEGRSEGTFEERIVDDLEVLEAAAIEAELELGPRDETVEEAKRHILVRIARVVFGFIVLLAGIIMLPLPGPGMVTVAAGLALLASDVPFARRLLVRVRARIPADADGRISKPILIGGIIVSVCTVSFSIWWTFLR